MAALPTGNLFLVHPRTQRHETPTPPAHRPDPGLAGLDRRRSPGGARVGVGVMAERHPKFPRASDDWYVEPVWCVDILLDRVEFPDGFHDPCCGSLTIQKAATARGIPSSFADKVAREPWVPVCDYLTDENESEGIVTNPPYNIAVKIIEHALSHVRVGGYVCALVQAKFLFSQKRKPLFERPEMERVIIMSRRPSMPPGEALLEHGEKIRGGGSIDFCWVVWRVGKTSGTPTIEWAV